MTTKIKRHILELGLIAIVAVGASFLARKSTITSFPLFEPTNLFTYFGVLIGFALTIYTFGLSMVDGIKQKVDTHTRLTQVQKTEIYTKLISGFGQIRSNI